MNYKFKTQPRQVQADSLKRAWGKPAWGHWWQMRVGKGVKTVYEMDALAQTGLTRFLVVCPKRVLSTWQAMIPTHSHTNWRVIVFTGKRILPIENVPTIVLTNYERVWADSPMTHGPRTVVHQNLVNWNPQFVVADEAQKLKNPRAKRSKAMYLLGSLAQYRRALSGTPDPKSYADYYGIFKFLDPGIFGSWRQFANTYLITDWFGQVRGYRNLDLLAYQVHRISDRVLRADCLDLPKVEEQVVDVTLPPAARKVYNALAAQMYAELEGGSASAPIVLTKLLRLAQVNGGFVTRDDGESQWLHDAKVEALMEVLEEVLEDAGQKAVVFFRFRAELERVGQRLQQHDVGFVELHGDTGNDSKVRAAFQTDQRCRVLLAQVASGSLGLDLSTAETAIFYSWDFDAATYHQARDRIWKPKGKLTYIHLRVPKSVDSTMLQVVQGKMERSRVLLDDWHRLVKGEAA